MMDWRWTLNIEPKHKPTQGRLQDLEFPQSLALLVGTYLAGTKKEIVEDQLDELERLGETLGLSSAIKITCPIRQYDAGLFIGTGKAEEIRLLVEKEKVNVVIFDDEISPQQQRNLENILQTIVVDRTELILSVFAQRAHSREAKIQIELASCRYQLPRLRRLWTHLSRQRSGGAGGGFVKGEGEKQIEIDRRIVRRKIDALTKEIQEVKKHRHVQRSLREKTGIPTFALVGYTNAGKSSLLNILTDAGVFVEDKLFATLDTTTRKFVLPNNQEILLVDTVGFIRKIPHLLVAAFKSTLEEALGADILIHLIDASHHSALIQANAACEVLKELGAEKYPMITVLNKLDQVKDRGVVQRLKMTYFRPIELSLKENIGIDDLMERMMQELSLLRKHIFLKVPQKEYGVISEVMRQGKVIHRDYEENDVLLEVEIPSQCLHKVTPFILEKQDSVKKNLE